MGSSGAYYRLSRAALRSVQLSDTEEEGADGRLQVRPRRACHLHHAVTVPEAPTQLRPAPGLQLQRVVQGSGMPGQTMRRNGLHGSGRTGLCGPTHWVQLAAQPIKRPPRPGSYRWWGPRWGVTCTYHVSWPILHGSWQGGPHGSARWFGFGRPKCRSFSRPQSSATRSHPLRRCWVLRRRPAPTAALPAPWSAARSASS